MPDPGSHAFDVARTRRRGELERDEVPSVPDQHADEQARAELEREHPPRLRDEPRAAGPAGSGSGVSAPEAPEASGGLALRSAAFSDSDFIPERYTKQGANVSPPLEWKQVPDGTAELALTCTDPDAPRGPFVHWALLHIDPGVDGLAEGATPPGTLALANGFGEHGWGGPLPPIGDEPHRYVFRLYALTERIDVGADATVNDLDAALAAGAQATGVLVGRFAR